MMKFSFQASILVLCLALFVRVSIADKSSVIQEIASKETDNSKSILDKDATAHGAGTHTDSNKLQSFDNGANTKLEHSKSVESEDAPAKGNGNLQDSNKQEPLGNGERLEIERSKSVENVDVASQGLGKATDSKKTASLTSGTAHETESEKSVENADGSAKGTGDPADSKKLASLVHEANKEVEKSKSVENADQVNGESEKIQPREGATDDLSKKVSKSSGILQALGNLTDAIKVKASENQTLPTLTLGSGNKTEHSSASHPKKDKDKDDSIDDLKVTASMRHPEKNATDDKNFWNKWSSSNQLVPRTSLLAAGAVICVLLHKLSAGLGLD